ncbi:MAG TPA: FAD-dependent oxidoreductase [Thermoanaerobaculia bacterium]|jgi:glycine/D-amino acid oxidase-like deaminating enzyme
MREHSAKVALSRREILRLGGAAAALAITGGCTSRLSTAASAVPAPRQRRLDRVLVDPERIIRRVVGLRPYRASGFVVRAEPLGDKLLVHDYGHGGAGVTLSWGTAELAADLVRESGRTGSAAVLGCGAVGLAAARVLQRRGFAVTIYARELPPGTTSSAAGASWYPAYIVDRARRTPEWDAQFERAARVSHRAFQGLVGEDYGVYWREEYFLTDDPQQEMGDWGLRDLFPQRRTLSAAENPFAARHVTVDNLMFIEPPAYLRAMMRDFELAGGRIVVRAFATPGELSSLPESVIVNCTGLGARELFGDGELTPIKGQLTVLLPQPEVDYAVLTPDLYMFPRRDGIMLGGTHERGVETLEPNLEAERRVLAGHRAIFDGMRTSA